MVWRYSNKSITTAVNSQNGITFTYGKGCTMSGSYLKWRVFYPQPSVKAYTYCTPRLRGGCLPFILGPSLRGVCTNYGPWPNSAGPISPSWSILKARCIIPATCIQWGSHFISAHPWNRTNFNSAYFRVVPALVPQYQVSLYLHPTMEWHCVAFPTDRIVATSTREPQCVGTVMPLLLFN